MVTIGDLLYLHLLTAYGFEGTVSLTVKGLFSGLTVAWVEGTCLRGEERTWVEGGVEGIFRLLTFIGFTLISLCSLCKIIPIVEHILENFSGSAQFVIFTMVLSSLTSHKESR